MDSIEQQKYLSSLYRKYSCTLYGSNLGDLEITHGLGHFGIWRTADCCADGRGYDANSFH